jgi:iron(III) transport system ATP-binding protein
LGVNIKTESQNVLSGDSHSARVQAMTAPHNHPMVALDAVGVTFGDIVALDDVSLDVEAGEILALLGPSGSGKSTLLRVIAGIARPSRGRVRIAGVEAAGPTGFVEPEHRRVGMVFQDYALFPHLTIAANVAFGLRRRDRAGVRAVVDEILDRLGLSRYADSYPHMLSGGERQRAALARALAPQPRVLLMDEPFSGLDGRLRDRVRQDTVTLLRDTHTTTIVVTHDPSEGMRVADRLAVLHDGHLLQSGPVEAVYTRPATPFVAQFLSEVNELAGTCRTGRVETALGTFAAPHVADATPVRVCVRPHHLRVAGAPNGIRARVLASEFLGEVDRITVEVPGLGHHLFLRTLDHRRLVPGDPVFLEVDPSGVVVVPDDHR